MTEQTEQLTQSPLIAQTTAQAQMLQCGIVYAWNCAGELYAIECALCDDGPLCTLAEFAEHMEIWHSNWNEEQQSPPPSSPLLQLCETTKPQLDIDMLHNELMQEVLEELEAAGSFKMSLEIYNNDDDDNNIVILEEQHATSDLPLQEITNFNERAAAAATTKTTAVSEVPEPLEEVFANTTPTTTTDTTIEVQNETVHTPEQQQQQQELTLNEPEQEQEQLTAAQFTPTSESKSEINTLLLRQQQQQTELLPVMVSGVTTKQSENELQLAINTIGAAEEVEDDDMQLVEDLLANINNEETAFHCEMLSHTQQQQQQSMPETITTEDCLTTQMDTILHQTELMAAAAETETTQAIANIANENTTASKEEKQLEQDETPLGNTPDPRTLSTKEQIQYGLNELTTTETMEKRITTEQVRYLIELYKAQPRLWNHTHPEFRNTELCRGSWHEITDAWNAHCQREFSITDIRIRVSTLCQRFMKQRERLEADGELDEAAKFVHYESLSFLAEQQTLQHRREHFERENQQIVSILRHYPVLWHTAQKNTRCPEKRNVAYRSISTALKLSGINLTPFGVQRRFQSLRKCYRLEKIRYLHGLAVEEGKTDQQCASGNSEEFVSEFKHYHEMEFMHKHIDPYVCPGCGKIFESLMCYREHVNNWNLSCYQAYEDDNIDDDDCTDYVENESSNLIDEIKSDSVPFIEEDIIVDDMMNEEKCKDSSNESNQNQELLVNVQCADYSYNLRLKKDVATHEDDNNELESNKSNAVGGMSQFQYKDRLSVHHTHELIALYKSQTVLWDPNHLDYHSRKQRRIAWNAVTAQLNKSCKKRYTWQTLYRKLTDYAKYYKREQQRLAISTTKTKSKWCFYNDFRFLDESLIINNEVQKTLQLRDNNLKIIEIYKAHPQLWCTDHPDYTRRKQRQRQTESMCTRLQEECNIQITSERLKSRLIEFRFHYRQAKELRLKEELKKNGTTKWTSDYEYYTALNFLDAHVAPFLCTQCKTTFKKRTDHLQHIRKTHTKVTMDTTQLKIIDNEHATSLSEDTKRKSKNNALDHICHICGLTFTLRNNLVAHLKRHLGQRNHACTLCPKKFFNTTALSVHTRSHTKELPFVCEICARGFVNVSKLNQHVKRHRNKRDFACNQCDKAFFSAFERDRHLRSHLNIRDKICPVCGRAFVVGSAYYAHLNLHRDTKRYACQHCGDRFAQYAGLYKHKKRCTRAQNVASD